MRPRDCIFAHHIWYRHLEPRTCMYGLHACECASVNMGCMRMCECGYCVKYRIHSKYYDIKYVNIYTFRDMETYISCKYIYLFVVLFVICFHSLQVNFHIHWPLLQKIVNTIRNSSNSERLHKMDQTRRTGPREPKWKIDREVKISEQTNKCGA